MHGATTKIIGICYIVCFNVNCQRYLAEQQTNTQKLLILTHLKRWSKRLGPRNRLQYDYLQCYQKVIQKRIKKSRNQWAHLYKDIFLCICTSVKPEYLAPTFWIVSLEPETQAETCVRTIKWSTDVTVTLCTLYWSYYRVIWVERTYWDIWETVFHGNMGKHDIIF
jgi:hypothetical protein